MQFAIRPAKYLPTPEYDGVGVQLNGGRSGPGSLASGDCQGLQVDVWSKGQILMCLVRSFGRMTGKSSLIVAVSYLLLLFSCCCCWPRGSPRAETFLLVHDGRMCQPLC